MTLKKNFYKILLREEKKKEGIIRGRGNNKKTNLIHYINIANNKAILNMTNYYFKSQIKTSAIDARKIYNSI